MFARLQSRGEGALGAFLMLGDPTPSASARLMDALAEGGADMLEVGIPFSDPIADGPVIQAAAARALANGTTTSDCFGLLVEFRARHRNIPIGILTYANIVVAKGKKSFYRSAAEAGVDSVLVADVPADEATSFTEAANAAGVDPVLIAAPNTPEHTLNKIARLSQGYTYCVSRFGVTGTGESPRLDHQRTLETLGAAGAPLPIFGFGISTPEHVKAALEEGAAGVIAGSAIVRLIEANPEDFEERAKALVTSLKTATRPTNVRSERPPLEHGAERG
jgi:tryptophan synthase alpha chain